MPQALYNNVTELSLMPIALLAGELRPGNRQYCAGRSFPTLTWRGFSAGKEANVAAAEVEWFAPAAAGHTIANGMPTRLSCPFTRQRVRVTPQAESTCGCSSLAQRNAQRILL